MILFLTRFQGKTKPGIKYRVHTSSLFYHHRYDKGMVEIHLISSNAFYCYPSYFFLFFCRSDLGSLGVSDYQDLASIVTKKPGIALSSGCARTTTRASHDSLLMCAFSPPFCRLLSPNFTLLVHIVYCDCFPQ